MAIDNPQAPVKMFGIYVASLSVSLGWGGQGGSMQMQLVEDVDNGVTLEAYGGLPATGTAVYFKYGNFFLGGIFQRWTYNESTSGRTYDIVIESPAKLMDGVQIIIEEFNGATDTWAPLYNFGSGLGNSGFEYSNNVGANPLQNPHLLYGINYITNYYNVFGYYENPVYGNAGEFRNFGNSGFNSAGLQIDKIISGITALSKRVEDGKLAGPLYFGAGDNVEEVTKYTLNLNGLTESSFFEEFSEYRLKGPVKNVNTILGEMADLFQFDYYYNIQPAGGVDSLEDGGGLISDAEIHVKVLDRTAPPDPGKIASLIQEDLSRPDDSKQVMSYNLGKEFGESVTQKVIWGGNRTRYIKVLDYNDSQSINGNPIGKPGNQAAIFGRNSTGSYNIISSKSNTGENKIKHFYDYGAGDYAALNPRGSLGNMFNYFEIYIPGLETIPGNYVTCPLEMRFALGGKEVWEIFKTFQTMASEAEVDFGDDIFRGEPNGFTNTLNCPWTGGFDNTGDILSILANDPSAGNNYDLTLTNLEKANKGQDPAKQEECDRIFTGVKSVAEASFGQQFCLFLPNEVLTPEYNYYLPAEEYTYLKSWDAAGSAFDSRPVTTDIANFDAMSKVVPLVGFDLTCEGADFSNLGSEYSFSTGWPEVQNTIFSRKGKPEKEMLWSDFHGRWILIYNTGVQIKYFDGLTTPDFGLTVLMNLFFNLDFPPANYAFLGKNSLQFACPPNVLSPNFFGVPQESSRFKWGPWLTLSSEIGFSPFGKTEVQTNESLRPETFGSFEELNRIGGIEASVGQSQMQEVESGYLEKVGAPEANLGERFADTGPYVSNMSISIDATGGVKTTYQFNTWTPRFGTMNKYNINRISEIRRRTFEYVKQNRDKIEVRPFPAAKFDKTDFSSATTQSHRQSARFDPMAFLLLAKDGKPGGNKCDTELCDREPGSGGPGGGGGGNPGI